MSYFRLLMVTGLFTLKLAAALAEEPRVKPTPTIDAKAFVEAQNKKLSQNLEVMRAKADAEFGAVPESDLKGKLRVALRSGYVDSQVNLLTTGQSGTPVPQVTPRPVDRFLKTALEAVREFERGLNLNEIREIVSSNPQSRFPLIKSFCSRGNECPTECSKDKLQKLVQSEPSLQGNSRKLMGILLLNASREDQYWPEYFPKLVATAKRKNAPPVVIAYYEVVPGFFGAKMIAGQKNIETSMYQELKANGISGSNEELQKFAYSVLAKEPECGHFHVEVAKLLRVVFGEDT